jgi:hypothetical protein
MLMSSGSRKSICDVSPVLLNDTYLYEALFIPEKLHITSYQRDMCA